MTQAEIQDLLSAEPERWRTTREIAEALKVGETSTSRCLSKLLKWGMIERREVELKRSTGYCKIPHWRSKKPIPVYDS